MVAIKGYYFNQVCSMECPNQSTDKQGFTHLGVVNSWLKVECALVTALASLPDPAMVCLPHPTALEWIVGLCGPSVDSVKAGTVVKAWVRPCMRTRTCTHIICGCIGVWMCYLPRLGKWFHCWLTKSAVTTSLSREPVTP